MNTTIDCRSALYMPAVQERVLAKGPKLAADAIILDLEDAVAPDVKELAREAATTALKELDYGYRIRALRINGNATPWFADDVAAAMQARPDALVLPKVESAADIHALNELMDKQPEAADMAIWAMVESPMAVLNAHAIAKCVQDCPRLSLLVVGSNDLARESNMPISADRTLLLPWLMSFIAAARAYGLNILDGVCNDFADEARLRQECLQGVAMGMDGKTLIHPAQIAIANEVFAPSASAIEDAGVIVATFAEPQNEALGVVKINGRMVERLHLDMAKQLLARADRLAERN
ncbi:HpcH/HpaI aldolase/citrate lyase family protein [Granulosicoccus antarcticus]|uniref:(3S)-malyl-CoA thioesterase n=1 Tax=Granulosicoccus antarcticus IMCC3135 TaxID=1192854 RepID=A0A2Z2NRX6_9GAMM|nr:CoA ester lyase [Granulosicoccus antarcticus]ASJ71490.1 (3S)-malyl-CoA thioesterase [Granulosicoccus antarcticus IMCC3135]